MEEERNVSQRILNGFSSLDYTFDVYEKYPQIYEKLKNRIPITETSFSVFELDTCIGCELICAAICHSMNWDFLRKVVKEKTIEDKEWLFPENLENITAAFVEDLLREYEKKDRIRAVERARILSDIGKHMVNAKQRYIDLFFDSSGLRKYNNIKQILNDFEAFSGDPAEKKLRLLIQCVSDYDPLSKLSEYYEPTIDYHVIRLYVRRGVVRPVRQETIDFLMNNEVVRKETTIGALRTVCADSMKAISWITQIDIKTVSRIEWWVARTICVNGKPDCMLERADSLWAKQHYDKCPFYDICQARNEENDFLMIDEPKYEGTSY